MRNRLGNSIDSGPWRIRSGDPDSFGKAQREGTPPDFGANLCNYGGLAHSGKASLAASSASADRPIVSGGTTKRTGPLDRAHSLSIWAPPEGRDSARGLRVRGVQLAAWNPE